MAYMKAKKHVIPAGILSKVEEEDSIIPDSSRIVDLDKS